MLNSKKFIDKKKSVTFQLVHRSQQDPLVVDETAPQRVLLPQEAQSDKEIKRDEQQKYGIYFDDGYNYLQHLKDVKDNRMEWPQDIKNVEESLREKTLKLKLPSSVFASTVEEEIGMLNKAAPITGPQLHLDPDIVAAMDEDFDYGDPDNQLEDNFIELASGIASDQEFSDDEFVRGSNIDDVELDESNSLSRSELSFNDEETKSRFTNYSMSSSVIRRNKQLTLLDDRFEKMYAEYDENEIGALDCEEIEGHLPESSDILLEYAVKFQNDQKQEYFDKEKVSETLQQLEKESSDESHDLIYVTVPEKQKWDCESVLSTYSKICNHPKLITEPNKHKIKISSKTGIPINVLDSSNLTIKAVKKLNEVNQRFESCGPKSVGVQSVITQLSTLSMRPKNETPVERKLRKIQLKAYRRERRVEKKGNINAFKEETKRQVENSINNKNNVQGNKIL